MQRLLLSIILLVGLALSSSLGAQEASLDSRLAAAEQIYRKKGPAQALPEFERLLQLFREQDDVRNEAIAQGFIGALHWRLGNFDAARLHLDLALHLKREVGDRLQEGKTLNVLGLLEWDMGHFNEAILRFGEASKIGMEAGDRKLEGATLNNLSLVYDDLGDYRTSLSQYQQVLSIYSGADFPRGESDTLGNIGGVYLLLGHYSRAADFYLQALDIARDLNSIPSMSRHHGNLGLSYTGMGRTETALAHFEEALKLAEDAGMRQEQGIWLRGMANAQIKAGLYDLGLENHRAALEIYAEVDARTLLTEALHDMGQLHLRLGDPTSADRYFHRAMELARSSGLSRAITNNQIALGDLQYRHQQSEAAVALYEQALHRALDSGERGLQASALLRLATTHMALEQFDDARQEIENALGIARETGARSVEAESLYMRAELTRLSGNPVVALNQYGEAEVLSAEVADPDLDWQIKYGRALALVQTDQKSAAVKALVSAVGTIENVRNRLREKRYRAGYIQDKHQVYIELVRLQLELGRTFEAFSTAERLRNWSFNGKTSVQELPGSGDVQHMAEVELRERIQQLQRNLEEEQSQSMPNRRQLAIDTFSRELLLAEQDYQAFLDDASGTGPMDYDRKIRLQEADMRDSLLADEALLEYVVGAESVMIFVMTSDGLRALSTPALQQDLHSRLELLRDLLKQRDSDLWKMPAASLSATVLGPVLENGWLDGVDHLYLVPHDMLNYLPFALLPIESPTGAKPVIDRFTLAYLPTASMLADKGSGDDQQPSILAMAPGRSRLQYAPEEISSISSLFDPHSRALLGDDATESAFKNNAGKYRFLHLATHGYFNKLNPLLSGLQLEPDQANDGLLEVHEILELRLDSDLVTLSACETALGSGFFEEIPAGDDFVSMTRAFLQVGSASVLATLWEVDDRSTVGLMKSFYQNLDASGINTGKAGALSQAQQALRASDEYKHPYYWAPFVLVGATNRNPIVRG
jgi:CHAT domain-containing protein/tetratricopeptide (TPR) repeat protein